MKADIFESDYSRATVITMYLLPGLNMKLRPKLLEMKPGTRLVSHQFTMEDWQPDETSYYDFRPAYLWIVPAKVSGEWSITLPGASSPSRMTFEQTFQKLRGTVDIGAAGARRAARAVAVGRRNRFCAGRPKRRAA